MKKKALQIVLLLTLFALLFGILGCSDSLKYGSNGSSRWTPEQAQDWYKSQPWLVGCNFIPSTAVNDVEMWQRGTFDSETIDRELGWAKDLGFNTVRVFLNYVVWEDDAEGLKRNFDQFLTIADKHGISTMPILFDDCNFSKSVAKAGRQGEPVPGISLSRWVSSPPLEMVTDSGTWPKLERYVKDMVGTFGQDRRIIIWDLYNEPGNSGMGQKSQPLMEKTFAWARAMKPVQPLTIGPWTGNESTFSRRMVELSDIVSFHSYGDMANIKAKYDLYKKCGRPILCTEWMARTLNSRFETHLPYFKEKRIGCWSFGMVDGRLQTKYPWDSPEGGPEPDLWFHEILHDDGTPYSEREVQLIKVITGKLPVSVLPK